MNPYEMRDFLKKLIDVMPDAELDRLQERFSWSIREEVHVKFMEYLRQRK